MAFHGCCAAPCLYTRRQQFIAIFGELNNINGGSHLTTVHQVPFLSHCIPCSFFWLGLWIDFHIGRVMYETKRISNDTNANNFDAATTLNYSNSKITLECESFVQLKMLEYLFTSSAYRIFGFFAVWPGLELNYIGKQFFVSAYFQSASPDMVAHKTVSHCHSVYTHTINEHMDMCGWYTNIDWSQRMCGICSNASQIDLKQITSMQNK